jgi:hypothetical protein
MIETILQTLGIVSTGTSVVLGVVFFKYRKSKASNDADRDNIALNKEQMAYINELSIKATGQLKEMIILREEIEFSGIEKRRIKRENERMLKDHRRVKSVVDRLKTDLENTTRELDYFAQHCKCQIQRS